MIRLTKIGLLGLACSGLLTACGDKEGGPVVSPELEAMEADVVLFNMEHVLLVEGVREAVVTADTTYRFNDSTVVYLRGTVRLTSFEEDTGVERAVITSDRARLDEASNSLTASGNAVLRIAALDRELSSEEINYEPDRNRVWSDSSTVMREGDTIVEGSGFTANLNFTNIEVTNPRSEPGEGGP